MYKGEMPLAAKRLKICIGENPMDDGLILKSWPINAHVVLAKYTHHRTASSAQRATEEAATMRSLRCAEAKVGANISADVGARLARRSSLWPTLKVPIDLAAARSARQLAQNG